MSRKSHDDLEQLLARALRLHQQAQLKDAEQLYQQILRASPGHFEAQHFLGILRHQQGRNADALTLIGGALKARPDSPQALSNQGLVLY